MSKVSRPVLRYHGGKFRLAPWISSFFPAHRVYVEPFGGAASVLMHKPRSHAEIYNDLDSELVNLFAVLRDDGRRLKEALRLTPFSRAEFELSYFSSDSPLEQARRTVVRSFQGFGGAAACGKKTGFRANSSRSNTTPAHDWVNYPDCIDAMVERLRGVTLENRDAASVISQHDAPTTLIYADPPYPHITRGRMASQPGYRAYCGYRYEMDDAEHEALASVLHQARGMVVVSGYACPLYDEDLYKGWERHTKKALADGASERTEVLWINPACSARLHGSGLFAEIAA
ncbi:DNA adenine methylase [Chitinimonas sp.]|uniref:DNA adenine methylase n=1 Tax=Chitinimonas sp. TaxID=1934313 RepID=UPI0035AE886B